MNVIYAQWYPVHVPLEEAVWLAWLSVTFLPTWGIFGWTNLKLGMSTPLLHLPRKYL